MIFSNMKRHVFFCSVLEVDHGKTTPPRPRTFLGTFECTNQKTIVVGVFCLKAMGIRYPLLIPNEKLLGA